MENNQYFHESRNAHTENTEPKSTGTARTAGSSAAEFGAAEHSAAGWSDVAVFQVTYLDVDCGRIRTETFDDAAAADRFASRCIADEDGWAVIDALRPREGRAAA